ncbi:YniB-like protein [Pseudomonas cuatrocienegasensis]|uniref:YniB-like protein n=1 Tax=Pseudomonas cuatrocienegasensis TaxID=543360 RepID=A0ABY1BL64_9PSED|nr:MULTISPECIES: YniB family protein [Pseudomonas]OEC34390.1 hypothetical protein A7D25_14400 [Pseudomonas sp. 21C1]SER09334.1 YniB-like protein [Pseudomonas cuatrocienegasensis]
MNYRQAKRKAANQAIIAFVVMVSGLIASIVSAMKMIYFRLDDGTALSGMLTAPLKNLISYLYYQPWFPEWLWQICPTPNPFAITDPENIKFLVVYAAIFVGAAISAGARKSKVRLAKINEEIENELLRQSLRGESTSNSRASMEENAVIPQQSIFSQVHQLYLAPIVVTIIGALLLKFGFGI